MAKFRQIWSLCSCQKALSLSLSQLWKPFPHKIICTSLEEFSRSIFGAHLWFETSHRAQVLQNVAPAVSKAVWRK